ncbi:Uncharacterised protein [Providencia rustigianii]|nr:Uncharacterised protein [Providencia rustigianii]
MACAKSVTLLWPIDILLSLSICLCVSHPSAAHLLKRKNIYLTEYKPSQIMMVKMSKLNSGIFSINNWETKNPCEI